ncbi:unnamed protein product [Owenia fusiformis]|uniref:Uncharacterized protein n=1 Tax=Owenia fusiformis TaxID=6347 RepID=A0A8J1UJC2_OWEFU|nr:unnamed protein product [Owenia fusiformis]
MILAGVSLKYGRVLLLRPVSSICTFNMSKYRKKHTWDRDQKKLRVLVDMDCVLADFETNFLKRYKEKYPDEPFIPLDKRKGFYLTTQYEKIGVHNDKIYSVINEEGFFLTLPPIAGGIEALKEMSGLPGVDVFLCTSPVINYQFCVKEKYDWVQKYLGKDWVEKLILTRDKTIIHGDLLIDDRPRIKGCEHEPLWRQVLFSACHNKTYKISNEIRLDSWDTNLWLPMILEAQKRKSSEVQ